MKPESNPYLKMPLSRVIQDARHGVAAARAALRERDSKSADALQIGIDADEHKARIIGATAEFFKGQTKRHKGKVRKNVRQ